MLPVPTIETLNQAHESFEKNEPRALFYRAARELVDLSLRRQTSLTLAEALAVLLQTWNRGYYRFRGGFKEQDFRSIEALLERHSRLLASFRERGIESYSDGDRREVGALFADFELALGPVGAAKALHLLTPSFFPLWDRDIASAYALRLRAKGRNAELYCRFMEIAREHCLSFGGETALGRNALKAWDEYNYVSVHPWMKGN